MLARRWVGGKSRAVPGSCSFFLRGKCKKSTAGHGKNNTLNTFKLSTVLRRKSRRVPPW
jgi:hypothetical protein